MSLLQNSRGWGVGGNAGCKERKQQAALCIPQAGCLGGQGSADLHRPWIQKLADKFGQASIRPTSRLGSTCRPRPGAQVFASRPHRGQITPGIWPQSHRVHLVRNVGATVIARTPSALGLSLL